MSEFTVDDVMALSPEKRVKALSKLKKLIGAVGEETELKKSAHMFKYFEPSDGTVTRAGLSLLNKYLNPEDIPQSFDSQIDAIVALKTNDILGVLGASQSGKTNICTIMGYSLSGCDLPLALNEIFPKHLIPKTYPIKGRVVGVDSKQLNAAVISEWKKFAPKKHLKNGSWEDSFNAEKKILTLYRGKRIIAEIGFCTNEQKVESFQGVQLHWVIYDEEPREEIRKENLARFTTSDKVIEIFGFTPTRGITWTSEVFFHDEEVRGVKMIKLASITNKKANLESLNKICSQETDYNKLKMRLLGDFVSLSGFVYSNLYSDKIHKIKPFPVNRDDFVVYRGLDPHLAKPTVCVEIAVDREGFKYVVGTYKSNHGDDTEIIKEELAQRAISRNYRLGWTNCDKSADSTIRIIGDYNAYVLLGRGKNAIPALFKSEKFVGSKIAGVDLIKQNLRVDEKIGLPKLFFFDIPENKEIIHSMKTLERDRFANEDSKVKDDIKEGKHDAHAALRYAHQRVMNWMPMNYVVPEPEEINDSIGY